MKYYYLHCEEILEKRRLKKLEDPDYKAKLEEKEKARAEKAAEKALERAAKKAGEKALKDEKRNAEKELKRKETVPVVDAKLG
jgi:hypothetical protein